MRALVDRPTGDAQTAHAGLFTPLRVGGLSLPNRLAVAPMTQADGVVARQEADFVSLGRGALTHADWPARLRAGEAHETFDRGLLAPIADLANAVRHRAELHLSAGGAPALDR